MNDGFCLEISVPAVIAVNERALWLYMKRKYGCEMWFQNRFPSEQITVKDALRLSVTSPLEKYLNVKSGVNSFRIHFTYTHLESFAKLQHSLANDLGCKRRKIEATKDFFDLNGISKRNANEYLHSESDAAILRAVNSLPDPVFTELLPLPPQKFSRRVSQSRWIIDDERMGEASVEEIVGSNALSICKGDSYKFHVAGREDIDVRMLGTSRPFLVEVLNARCMPSKVDVQQIADTINNSSKKYIKGKNLKVVDSEVWDLMREGEAEKQEILQRTPIRVLHRRSPLEHKRIIHWMKIERLTGSCQYFLLHLCTQAGTYIKEFVHGDLGCTHASIGSIIGCRAEILQLDVTDEKMDFFE